MLKIYRLPDGTKRQYEAGQQPAGAVEVKARKPKNKARTVKNKAVSEE